MKYSIAEAEILCKLDLSSNAQANKEKIELATYLAGVYSKNSKDVNKDTWKVRQYQEIAGIAPPIPTRSKWLSTHTFYNGFGWVNSFRVLLWQTNRFSSIFMRSLLPNLFNFAGLGFGVNLIFNIGVVTYTTFIKAPDEEEKKLPILERTKRRFINVMFKDGRISRMLNDAVWFSINLAGFFLTSGLSTFLNFGGFTFDVFHEIGRAIKDDVAHKNLLNKIRDEISEKKAELLSLKGKNEPNRVNSLEKDIASLTLKKTQLQKEITSVRKSHALDILSVSLMLVGMLMVAFAPTTLPGLIIVGAGVALFGGSIIGGFGRRVYGALRTLLSTPTKIEQQVEVAKPIPQPASPKNAHIHSYANQCEVLLKAMPDLKSDLIRQSNLMDEEERKMKDQYIFFKKAQPVFCQNEILDNAIDNNMIHVNSLVEPLRA